MASMGDDETLLERLWALFDEAEPVEDASARERLRDAGLDPVLVRARLGAHAAGLMARTRVAELAPGLATDPHHPPLLVPWVKRTEAGLCMEPAVAGVGREERSWITLDFGPHYGGGVRVGLFLHADRAGESSLVIEWDAEFFHPSGWRLRLYHAEDDHPFFDRNVGAGYRGSAVFPPEVLGVDPGVVPLRFGFSPDTP